MPEESLDLFDGSKNKISFRIFLWKLLLGEEAVFPNNRKEHSRWKERTYCDCKRLLKSSARIDDGWPLPKTLNVMWLLYDVKLNLDFNKQVKPVFLKNCTRIIIIAAIWALWSKMRTLILQELLQPASCRLNWF